MKAQRRVMLFVLPILVLGGWVLYEEILIWNAGSPRWVESASGRGVFRSCGEVERYARNKYEITPLNAPPSGIITIGEAGAIINRVEKFFPLGSGEPTLGEAKLPDGQRRPVWYRLDLVNAGKSEEEGEMAIVFVDAYSGEVLLVENIEVFDPFMAGCDYLSASASVTRVSPNQATGVILLSLYLVVAGSIAWLKRVQDTGSGVLPLRIALIAVVFVFGVGGFVLLRTYALTTPPAQPVVLPTPTLNDEAIVIKRALLAKLGWSESDVEYFSVKVNTGQIAHGWIKRIGEENGAGWWAARDAEGQWVFAYVGHGIPRCSEIERPPFDFPKDWFPYCTDASGSVIER